MRKHTATLIATTVLAATTLASAANAKDYLTLYTGYYDFNKKVDTAAEFGIEYRADALTYGIRPIVGINVTTDSSVYGYAGLNWDIPLIDKQLYLIPNFAIGAYSRGDSKRDLGGALEFRSGIELAYEFTNGHRLGAAVNHISNAGIYDKNPGTEAVLVTYSVPLSVLTGK